MLALHSGSQIFASYSCQLEGVTIIQKKLKEASELSGFLGTGSFDAVIDNNSKEVAQAAAIADAVKVGKISSIYMVFVDGHHLWMCM